MMTHAALPKNEGEKLGITGGFVRLSVGIEDVEDLIADLDSALNALGYCEKKISNYSAYGRSTNSC